MLSLMSWGTTESDGAGLLDDVWDAADLQVRNLDKALFLHCMLAINKQQPLLFTCFLLSLRAYL